jgi:DsbC/DsbD-like thiol-disulfide interchange protein
MKVFFTALAVVLSTGLCLAQKKSKDYVQLAGIKIEGKATPGARVSATLHFKINKGYHTQSHKPSEEFFIPTVVKLKSAAGIRVGKVAYPKGHNEKVDGLDKPLSVYDEEFRITVPLAISAQAKLPATLKGTLDYQACKGAVCYPPQKLKIEIKLEK